MAVSTGARYLDQAVSSDAHSSNAWKEIATLVILANSKANQPRFWK